MTLEQYLLEFLFTCEVSTNDSIRYPGRENKTNKQNSYCGLSNQSLQGKKLLQS